MITPHVTRRPVSIRMHRLWLRCLIVFLSLALVGGNAHAALSMDVAGPADPCVDGHEHQHAMGAAETEHSDADHDNKAHHDDHGCCCECLGCTTAMNVTPVLLLVPRAVSFRVRFEHQTSALATRALDPELDPPRPITLI